VLAHQNVAELREWPEQLSALHGGTHHGKPFPGRQTEEFGT
jgi:hypothetical protein